MNSQDTIQPEVGRIQERAFMFGGIGLALCVVFGPRNADQFFRSYLFAYIFWLAIPLGCTSILMLHHLTGGWWGYPIRRLLEAGTRTFSLMAILFIPVWLGMSSIYPWMHGTDKAWFLNPGFFTLRAVIYFAIWLSLSFFLNKWSSDQDRTADPRLADRLEAMSAPGLILWGLAVTFSAIDWVMSLEPNWFSTMYGMIFMMVETLTAMAFVILVLRKLSGHEPIKEAVTPSQFNDLGNLMLAFVMLWAYLSFSQFLIIWAGNIKGEIPWYMSRAFGKWGTIAAVLIVLHFALPFLLLLQRGVKRRLRVLSTVAGMLILLSIVDVFWLVVPAFERAGPRVHPMDIFALIGIGGIWVGTFAWQLKKWPLLPQHDPRFEGALEHEHGD
ncbi:MAG: hypothetical protein WBP79_14245 [Candidatus Acidiferrales bacterium]